jgi:hypothetical protein
MLSQKICRTQTRLTSHFWGQSTLSAQNLDQLIANVKEAFDELPLDACKRVWLTAQTVMNLILLVNKSNNYTLQQLARSQSPILYAIISCSGYHAER